MLVVVGEVVVVVVAVGTGGVTKWVLIADRFICLNCDGLMGQTMSSSAGPERSLMQGFSRAF